MLREAATILLEFDRREACLAVRTVTVDAMAKSTQTALDSPDAVVLWALAERLSHIRFFLALRHRKNACILAPRMSAETNGRQTHVKLSIQIESS